MGKIGDSRSAQEIIEDDEIKAFEMSNVSLKLASYNDIFSSFDPRTYTERSLSVDFLDEAKRASIDKGSGEIELILLIPKDLRKPDQEKTIKKRLREHFERHFKQIKQQYSSIIRNGLLFVLAGIITMFLASYLLFRASESNMFVHFLLITFEPAGWFFFWEGLYQIIFESKRKKPDIEFYSKMARSIITFMSY